MPIESSAQLAKNVWSILEASKSSAYIGEPISQFEHAVQAADRALNTGSIDEVVLAALLHDIGHLVDPNAEQMDELGTVNHERLGAKFLSDQGFSTHDRLSTGNGCQALPMLSPRELLQETISASCSTLEWQGGPVDGGMRNLRAWVHFEDALRLSSFDEQAKEVGYKSPNLALYQRMLKALTRQRERKGNHS